MRSSGIAPGTSSPRKIGFIILIARAQYLIENKYTSPRYLSCEGTSAGGFLSRWVPLPNVPTCLVEH